MSVEIIVGGKRSLIKGAFPKDDIDFATSAYVNGYQYSPMFRRRRSDGSRAWDGKMHLFSRISNTFATGVLDIVCEVLNNDKIKYEVVYPESAVKERDWEIPDTCGEYVLYDYQKVACADFFKKRILPYRGVIKIGTGGGKCLGLDEPILMYDGSIKKAKDIEKHDLLMGPDSKKRIVVTTTKNIGRMYKIIPLKGEPWTCNDVHVLTLVDTVTDKTIDIPLNEYLNKSKPFKHRHKLFIPDKIIFPSIEESNIDPYFLGVWFGDGSKRLDRISITTEDIEIKQLCREVAGQYNLRITNYSNPNKGILYRCPTYNLVGNNGGLHKQNNLLNIFKKEINKQLDIPDCIKYGSIETRKQFLAGFIDTDGYLHHGFYEIIQKRKDYVEDLAFIARSLGLRATYKPCVKTIKSLGFSGEYFRLNICGDVSVLPVKISRKKANKRKQIKDIKRTGFKVEYIGLGEYAGFEISDDGRFLLGDFTVTHNTVCGATIARVVGGKTLFLVHGKKLTRQNHEVFQKVFKGQLQDIGMIDAKRWEPNLITIASSDTLYARMKNIDYEDKIKELFEGIVLVIVDECHRSSSKSFAEILKTINAPMRVGLSGTPNKKEDDRDLLLHSLTGPIVFGMGVKGLKEVGAISKAHLVSVIINQPVLREDLDWQEVYESLVVNNKYRHEVISKLVAERANKGKTILLLAGNSISLADQLYEWVTKLVDPADVKLINGLSGDKVVDSTFKDLQDKKIKVVITTTIADEGLDIPAINCLIVAGGGKSFVKTIQRVGRCLRLKSDCSAAEVVDVMDITNSYLRNHAKARLNWYEEEELFDSSELIKAEDIMEK